jgi:hypothetical protein
MNKVAADAVIPPVVPPATVPPVVAAPPMQISFDPNTDGNVLETKGHLEQLEQFGMKDTEEYKSIETNLNKFITDMSAAASGQPVAPPVVVVPPGTPPPVVPPGTPPPVVPPGTPPLVKSAFFGDIVADPSNPPVETPQFTDPGQLQKFIAEKLALGETSDVNAIIKQASEWKESSEKLNPVQAELTALRNSIQSFPSPIFNAITEWSEGKDWQTQLKGQVSLDYNKPYESYDPKEMVSHFFPERQFTDEEVQKKDPSYTTLIGAAGRMYAMQKQSFETTRSQMMSDLDKTNQGFRDSVSKSFASFDGKYKAFDKSAVQKVRTLMEKDAVQTLFKNQDGSYKPEAAELLAFALEGPTEVQNLLKALKERSNVMQQAVGRGNQTIPQGAQAPKTDPTQEQILVAQMEKEFHGNDIFASKSQTKS